jgi:hypothetical protein
MAHSSSGMLGKLISLIMKGWLKTKEGSFFNQLMGNYSIYFQSTIIALLNIYIFLINYQFKFLDSGVYCYACNISYFCTLSYS